MVHTFGALDGQLCALDGLSRIALQPQRPCQSNTGPIVPFVGQIDGGGPLRARPNRQQSLKLDAGAAKVAHDQQ
jgi:hypothetical protein